MAYQGDVTQLNKSQNFCKDKIYYLNVIYKLKLAETKGKQRKTKETRGKPYSAGVP